MQLSSLHAISKAYRRSVRDGWLIEFPTVHCLLINVSENVFKENDSVEDILSKIWQLNSIKKKLRLM
jgi:hypothetical protein